MRETLLTAAAAAVMLSSPLLDHRATALTLAAPAAMVVTAPRAAVIERVVNVCGTHGCVPVQTKRVIHHRKPGNTVPHHI